jgi:hypothetical protein
MVRPDINDQLHTNDEGKTPADENHEAHINSSNYYYARK